MGSIRPLFTITVLVVVGAYLYVKINEGPTRPHAGAHGNTEPAQDGIPPLASTGGGATLAQDTSAPAWPPATSSAAPAAPAMTASVVPAGPTDSANTTATNGPNATKNALPEVPPIPELPELPQTSDVAPSTPPAVAPPIELPKNVPAARYGDEVGPNLGPNATADTANALPALPTMPAMAGDNATPPAAPSALTPAAPAADTIGLPSAQNAAQNPAPQMPPTSDRYGLPTTQPTPPAPAAPSNTPAAPPNDLRSPAINTPAMNTPTSTAGDDRYGAGASSTLPPVAAAMAPSATNTLPLGQPNPATGASFAASWPAIQAALDRRDLKQAHQLLSKWHNNDSLSPVESQQVESLLGQLAGTVIYSNEHQLEPARVVRPGETLDSIAKEYNVPWQLLAKINGIPAPDQVRPGQELKVVRGPFSATIDLRRKELELEVDGRFAGTFAIDVPPDVPATEGQWLVEQKLGGAGADLALASAPPATPYRRIVLRSANAGVTGAKLMIDADYSTPSSHSGAIRVAAQDAEDISDILSVGSRVTVRR